MDLKRIQKKLKRELDAERYDHTIGVTYTAAALAMAHGYSIENAQLAGLLHDCAKCIPNDIKVRICINNKIEVSQIELENPFLLHAKLGAFLAREEYQIKNDEILHAIRVHTTGVPGMSELDKIIYIADYIEPHRNRAANLAILRKLAFRSMDEAMLGILEDTLQHLKSRKGIIDPSTQGAYDYFKMKEKRHTLKEDHYESIR